MVITLVTLLVRCKVILGKEDEDDFDNECENDYYNYDEEEENGSDNEYESDMLLI